MSSRHRPPAVVAVGILAALVLAACGTEVIDQGEAEDFIREQLEPGGRAEVGSVECPDDVEVERGATFECQAESRDGRRHATVTLNQLDDDGRVRIEDVRID